MYWGILCRSTRRFGTVISSRNQIIACPYTANPYYTFSLHTYESGLNQTQYYHVF